MTNSPRTPAIACVSGIELSPRDVLLGLRSERCLRPLLLRALAKQVVVGSARSEGLTVPEPELQRAADLFRLRNALGSAQATRAWLAREGISAEDFEAELEAELLVEKFRLHLTEPRLAEHFAGRRDRYARARLSQVVVASEDLARELRCQVAEEGRDFAELCRLHSLDGPTRAAGGRLGLVPRYAVPPGVAESVFGARAGDVVGPVATEQGYHLFLVEELLPAELDADTVAVIRQELFDAWLRERLEHAVIDLSWLEAS